MKLILELLIIILLPSFIFVSFQWPSLSLGMAITAFILISFNINHILNTKLTTRTILICLSIIIYLSVNSTFNLIMHGETKPVSSLLILLIMSLGAYAFSLSILKSNYQKFANSFLFLIFILLIIGWLEIFYTPTCCGYNLFVQPIFPFSEPSHYSLALGMLLIPYAITGNKWLILFFVSNTLLLAFIYPNLTIMIIGIISFLVLFLRAKPKLFKWSLMLLPILTSIVFINIVLDTIYFSHRFNFENPTNLSTLVFLQGWELAYINFINTHGAGLGFQMLGLSTTHTGEFTKLIIEISELAYGLNIKGGGFLAAKLIAEFGVIGLFMILFYIYYLIKFIFYANNTFEIIRTCHNTDYVQHLKKQLLLKGIVFAFFVDVFLRSTGYFSPEFFLTLGAAFALFKNHQKIANIK